MSNSVFVRGAEFDYNEDMKLEKVIVKEGDAFTIRCDVPKTSFPPPIVWTTSIDGKVKGIRNESRITSDPDGNLHFSNITLDDESNGFHYQCVLLFTPPFPIYISYRSKILIDVIPISNQSLLNAEPKLQYVTEAS